MDMYDSRDDRECVSIPETCRKLDCGRSKTYGLIREGKLEAVKIGRLTRITLRSIRKLARTGG